ncbi:MAG: hypothetical protein IJU56_09845 [Clostridia bacterium]|nr:hypothetical protein [Clostridia bacterium]
MTTVSEEELRQINEYTRRALSAEEVYVFSVTLCDNEVDRDFERFSIPALQGLAPLFLGKSGIFDHDQKAGGQSARIFKTWVEENKARTTAQGEPYTMLRAKAYMVRTEKNRSLIEEIDGGIKKEVSVGCSMGAAKCSICGKEHRSMACEHRPGTCYGKEVCHLILDDPRDAYEWSFVAVPAQRAAGVTKAFKKEALSLNDTLERIKSAKSGLQLSADDVQRLKAHLTALEQAQRDAKTFRDKLFCDIEKYLLLALPQINAKQFLAGCRTMSADDLQELCKSLQTQAADTLPPALQLKHNEPKMNRQNNRAFCI